MTSNSDLQGDGVKLTKAQRSLLGAVNSPGDGWHADIMRAHPKHLAELMLFRQRGLVTFTPADTRVRITPAGLALLNAEKKP